MHVSFKFVEVVLVLGVVGAGFILVAVKGDCGIPPAVENADHDGGSATSFTEGHLVSYTCEYGFAREGNGRTMCRGNAWVGLVLTCSPKSCGDPGQPTHGSRDSEVFTFGAQVTFTCDEGYSTLDRKWIVCQANGLWSNQAPTCNPKQCPQLNAPQHGRIFPSNERDYRTEVRVSCDDDYELTGSATRECQADQTWSGQEGVCNLVACALPHLQDGSIEESNIQLGDIVYFRCYENTTRDGDFSATCTAKNTFSNPVPKCWRKCVVPEIENGLPVHSSGESALTGEAKIQHNRQLFFQCGVGFELDNKDPARCNNGTLDHVSRCVDLEYPTQSSTLSPGGSATGPTPSTKPETRSYWPKWLTIVLPLMVGLLVVLCLGLCMAFCCKKCKNNKEEDPEKPKVILDPEEEEEDEQVPPSVNYRMKFRHFYLENGAMPLVLCANSDPSVKHTRVIAVPKRGDPDDLPDIYVWYEHKITGTLRNASNNLCLDATEEGAYLKSYIPGNKTQQWACAYKTIQNRHNSDWLIALPSGEKSRRVHAVQYTEKSKLLSSWNDYETGPQPIPAENNHESGQPSSSRDRLLNSPTSDNSQNNRVIGQPSSSGERSPLNSPTSDDSDAETKV